MADAAIGFLSRIDTLGEADGWKIKETQNPLRTLRSLAPDFLRELFDPSATRDAFLKTEAGLLLGAKEVFVGPVIQALVTVFAAKLGMALYCHLVGEPLSLTGGVYTVSYLNAGFNHGQAEAMFRILSSYGTLTQGQGKSASGQFDYIYNTDGKSLTAALSHFHGNVSLFTVAACEPDKLNFPAGGRFTGFIRPGELLQNMPKPRPAILMPGANWSPNEVGLFTPKRRH